MVNHRPVPENGNGRGNRSATEQCDHIDGHRDGTVVPTCGDHDHQTPARGAKPEVTIRRKYSYVSVQPLAAEV
jgi:hypothetical protein